MSTTAQQIVEAAYNRSTANAPGKLADDAELLPQLDRVIQRLWGLLAKARPDEIATTTNYTLAHLPPDLTMPADTVDVLAVQNADGLTVNIIPVTERTRLYHAAPCMYRLGYRLVSRFLGDDPIAGDVVTLTLTLPHASITTLATVIDTRFPVRHHQLAIDLLALYLDTKDEGRDAESHKKLLGEVAQSAAVFVAEYGLPPSAMQWTHAPVERSAMPA